MPEPSWPLQDAKAQFSAVVDAALEGVVQHVTRRGQRAVVVISEVEYERLRRRARSAAPGLVKHLLAVPKGRFPAARSKVVARDVEFE